MRILQTLIAFSGNAPPQLAITRRLVERGHEVHVLGHRAARERIERTGAQFAAFKRVLPDMDLSRAEMDPVQDWAARTPIGAAIRMRDRGIGALMRDTADEVSALVESVKPDAVLFDFLLIGAGVAAESAGVPAFALVHCPYPIPVEGAPPLGSGLMPATGAIGRMRERVAVRGVTHFYAPLLRPLNTARADHGLGPVERWSEQLARADGIHVLTAPELDFASRGKVPSNVAFSGPAVEAIDADWTSPWPSDDDAPLVVVSFSTSYMDQSGLAQRVLSAVDGLRARVLLTAGPALDTTGLSLPGNTKVVDFVPHGAVLPHAALMVTHAGWGTVTAALCAGVPLVCIPDGRDQPDNAARVVAAGAGVRVRRSARPATLRREIERALADESLKAGASRMAIALARRDGADTVAEAVEALGTRVA